MGYKGNSVMDCGYYVGGHPDGLLYFPPPTPDDPRPEPGLIPWSELLDEEKCNNEKIAKFVETWKCSEDIAIYYIRLFDWDYDKASDAYWRQNILIY